MSAVHYKIVLAVVALSATAALIAVACGGATQFQTVQTFEAEERVRISTATAEAMVAAGLDPDALASGGAAATFVAERALTSTAEAEAGGGEGVGSGSGSGSEQAGSTDIGAAAADFVPEVPEGPAQEGEVTVFIEQGEFDPQVIKVKVGTKVIWQNKTAAASSATALGEQAEQWDTGDIWRSAFNPEVCCGEHVFKVPGDCYVYRSLFSNDIGVGAVCVEE